MYYRDPGLVRHGALCTLHAWFCCSTYHPQLTRAQRKWVETHMYPPPPVALSEQRGHLATRTRLTVHEDSTAQARVPGGRCLLLNMAKSVLCNGVVPFLTPWDLGALLPTCRQLHNLVEEEFVWRALCARDFPASLVQWARESAEEDEEEEKEKPGQSNRWNYG